MKSRPMFVFGCAMILLASYWVAALKNTIPLSDFLRAVYHGKGQKMGIGNDYEAGRYILYLVVLLGVMGIRFSFGDKRNAQ